jgi:hypothetical protein
MSRGRALRLVIGMAVLVAVVARIGPSPFAHGLRAMTPTTLAASVVITALTTTCAAWRWTLVAHGLGVRLPLPVAVAAYYRSQLLNLVLPGGIVGDVHRGVVHGRDVGSVGGGLRAVAWERTAGQLVQAAVAIVVLAALPSPVRAAVPAALLVLGAAAAVAAAVAVLAARMPAGRVARAVRAVTADLRAGPLARGIRLEVALASLVVVAGHTTVFLIAAHAAGASASVSTLLPLAILVQLATSAPLGIAGWGPREGAAAWAFAAAGLGAATGVAITTLYGVLALASVSPGAAVLVAEMSRKAARRRVPPHPAGTPPQLAIARSLEGGNGG